MYPRDTHFELYYGRTLIDVFGLVVSGAGLLLLIGCASRRTTASRVENVIAAPFRPLLATFERHYFVLSVFFLAIAVAGGALTRYSLRLPERRYQKAQEAYRARDFDKAIELLEAWTAADKETFKQATALYQLGVSYSEIGNHAAATHVHERLRFDFANVNYGAGTLFHLARNYARLGETERAKHYAALLEQEHPDTSWLKRLQKENSDLFGSG